MPPAASFDIEPVTVIEPVTPSEPVTAEDAFDGMTDRELLLTIARSIHEVRAIAVEAGAKVSPLIEGLSKNPMLKMFFK